MLEDLLAQPGVEEVCELRSRFGVMALHGGNLERGTDVIAAAAAERAIPGGRSSPIPASAPRRLSRGSDSRTSHAMMTADAARIPAEMKKRTE